MSSISGNMGITGAPIGETSEPEQIAAIAEGPESPDAVLSRSPTSTMVPSLDSELLRRSLAPGSDAASTAAAAAAGPESFADRMARLTTERKDLGWSDVPNASRSGLREDWNKALLKAANTDLGGAKKAEREISKLVERGLKKAIEEGGSEGEITGAQISQISKALASELAEMELGGVSIEALGSGADLLVADLGKALVGRLMFQKTESEVKRDARREGGMFPGEAADVQDKVGFPLAEKVSAQQRAVEAKLKTTGYFKVKVKIDAKKLFSALDEVVKAVKVDTGFAFEKGDFRAKIGAEVTFDKPLSAELAEVSIRGFAETRYKGFSAGIEGRAKVESLYDDPQFGPTADVSMYARYGNERISAGLDARTSIPLNGSRDDFTWGADASLRYKVSDRASFSAGIGVDGGFGRETTPTANIGFTLKF